MFLIFLRRSFSAALCSGALLALAIFTSGIAIAQTETPDRAHIEEVLRGMSRGRSFGQVAISPDGKKLAWIERGRGGAEILLAAPDDLTKSQRVTAATQPGQHCREGELSWEPDPK